MYNRTDVAEFVLRVPTPVAEGQTTTTLHYSEVIKNVAENSLYRLEEIGGTPDQTSSEPNPVSEQYELFQGRVLSRDRFPQRTADVAGCVQSVQPSRYSRCTN